MSQFEVTPNAQRALKQPDYLGHLKADFDDVPTLDTETNEQVRVDYFVEGRLFDRGERLLLSGVSVIPFDPNGIAYDTDYRFRPGLGNTVGMAQAIAQRLHEDHPAARTLEMEGHRVTRGFVGKKDQRLVLSLDSLGR